jgi:hypothetical protein
VHSRRWLRIGPFGAAALLLVGATACSGSSVRADTTQSGLQAGLAFLQAYRPFLALGGIEAERSIILPEVAKRQCAAYPRAPGPKLTAKLHNALSVASDIRLELALIHPYLAFSQRLSRLHLKPRALQVVARADATVAAELKQHLVGARFDLCAFLSNWKAHGWRASYGQRLQEMPFGRSHRVNRRRLQRAFDNSVAVMPQLQRLGLTFRQALEISGSAGGF